MSQPGLYFDEDASKHLFRSGLIEARLTFAPVADMNGATDDQQLGYAAANGLVLVSYNRGDFARLHYGWVASGVTHSGILLLFQQRFDGKKELRLIREFLSRETAEGMQDQLRFITQYDVDG